ncbi:unnamed protein product [Lupinus luteus]|uniref:Uncharacterized protein n=1 Tax=Lupinus luteus TaxID=3873 RepID=A0AAV1WEK4_LUPLU
MVGMLPLDVAVIVFVPSEEAFSRYQCWSVGVPDGFVTLSLNKFNDAYAIVTHILRFSAVPCALSSVNVRSAKMLVVNRIRSEAVDVTKTEIVIHVMDGICGCSFQPPCGTRSHGLREASHR